MLWEESLQSVICLAAAERPVLAAPKPSELHISFLCSVGAYRPAQSQDDLKNEEVKF